MRGPLAAKRNDGPRPPVDNSPNRKTRRRLERRQAAFSPGSEASGLLCHRPGSQNRKK